MVNTKLKVDNLKVVVFDFDDTIYNANCWIGWGDYVKVMLTKILGKEKDAEAFVCKHAISYRTNGQQIAMALISEKGSAKEMIEYLKENIYDIWTKDLVHLENKDFKKIAKNYHLYILSNSPTDYLIHHLDKMGINRSLFKGIYQNDFDTDDPTKKKMYTKILNREGCLPEEAVMIGDSFPNDIVPAVELGMQGAWVNSIQDVRKIIKELEEKKK